MPATPDYRIDGLTTSVAVKAPCLVATTANIALSGEQTINGTAVVTGDRVLVTAQTDSVDNGIYVADTSEWQRAADFDGARDAVYGTLIVVVSSSGSGSLYRVTTTDDPIVFGTSDITFDLSVFGDAATVAFQQAGTGAVVRTAQAKMREVVSVTDFGAVGDGVTNDATAVSNALTAGAGRIVYFPKPSVNYLVSSTLTVADNAKTTLYGDGAGSIIKKNFNGTLISLGAQCQMENLYLDGSGATFTGIGVSISTGTLDFISYRNIKNCWIMDTASYGIEFTADSAGYFSKITDCTIVPYNNFTIAAIKMPTLGTAETNGNRHLINIITGSNHLCDFGDCDNAQVVGCDGGLPIMGAFSQKITFAGTRMVSVGAANLTFQGTAHSVSGCTINITGAVIFAAGLQNFHFDLSNSIGSGITITDNALGASGGDNQIWYNPKTYTPTLSASGGGFALGNGSLSGRFWRQGSRAQFRIIFVFGSTSNIGVGNLIYTLPFAAATVDVGSAIIRDVSVAAEFVCAAEFAFGAFSTSSQGILMTVGAGVPIAGAGVPMVWATGDYFVVSGSIEIA